jgi:hypothetical protein
VKSFPGVFEGDADPFFTRVWSLEDRLRGCQRMFDSPENTWGYLRKYPGTEYKLFPTLYNLIYFQYMYLNKKLSLRNPENEIKTVQIEKMFLEEVGDFLLKVKKKRQDFSHTDAITRQVLEMNEEPMLSNTQKKMREIKMQIKQMHDWFCQIMHTDPNYYDEDIEEDRLYDLLEKPPKERWQNHCFGRICKGFSQSILYDDVTSVTDWLDPKLAPYLLYWFPDRKRDTPQKAYNPRYKPTGKSSTGESSTGKLKTAGGKKMKIKKGRRTLKKTTL